MRHQLLAVLTWCTVAGIALGSDPPQKKAAAPATKSAPAVAQKSVAQKTVPQKSLPQKSIAQKSVAPKSMVKKGAPTAASTTARRSTTSGSKSRYSAYRRPVSRYSPAPQSPTPDRYREIQDALAAKGYLKTPSNGVWDKDSIDAMQRFQKDKNLDPTGKLTARSLGALGLGPQPAETYLAPANPSASVVAPLQ